MSSLPSQMISSSLQGTLQQQQAQQGRSIGERRRSDTRAAVVQGSGRLQDQIDSADADTQVNPDGTGAGGQGRAFQEPRAEATAAPPQASSDGSVTTDSDGRMHLDVTA